jgi:RNA polymerase sigma factor (sigma-70 family)
MRDPELLKEYLHCGSETAFAELVNRYLALAYSVARRQVRDPNLAEEVVQMMFCLLAGKARDLSGYDSVAGWIYRATYNISLKMLRDERKRREREHSMADLYDQTRATPSEQPWEEIAPLLDDALSKLTDGDRTVLILRFVRCKPMRELGQALGTSEAAAKMRVGRAIDRIRKYLQKQGIACSTASLGAALAALSTDAAPAGLSASVLAAALASSGAKAFAVSSLAKTLILMAKLKTKLVLVGCGAVAVVMTGSYLLDHALVSAPRPTGVSAPPRAGANPAQPGQRTATGVSGFSERMAEKLRNAGLARASAKLRAALNAPPRRGTRSYPSPAIEEAVAAFGPYQDQAFAVLKEAIDGDNPGARLEAIAALSRIGKNVPEARPLLWQLLRSGEDRTSFFALGALGNIGFLPEDIPNLAAMIPGQSDPLLIRYLPEQIARAIKQDPEGMKPQLGPVESLLHHEDPATRFSAACALAELRGAQDPDILKGLAAGLAVSDRYRLHPEAPDDGGEGLRHLMAVETLQRMGPAAKAVLPELQNFVQLAPDSVIRGSALRAIGAIDAEVGQSDPAVHSVLTADDQRNTLRERLQAGTWSSEDLLQGLQEPATTTLAASRLAALGPNAKGSLPDLQRALAGKDEATRDEILEAIKQIDSEYVVPRVSGEPVARGAVAAQLELELQRSQGEVDDTAAKSVEGLIDRFRMGNTSWYTQSELAEFKQELQKRNPRIWNAFLAKASEVDPSLESVLTKAHD